MDGARAVELNRQDLLRVLAGLFLAVGLVPDTKNAMVPRFIRRAILVVLRPAEAAVRRLVVIVREALPDPTPGPKRGSGFVGAKKSRESAGTPAFPLFDPRKRFGGRARRSGKRPEPRIWFFDGSDPPFPEETPAPTPDDPIAVGRLLRRLKALEFALSDLPKQAARLARMQARDPSRRDLRPPIRPCDPPGHRKRHRHEIDAILQECHQLTLRKAPLDTS